MAKKEAEKFGLSDIMEGMISIRAVIRGAESGVNDRKIEKIIYDEARGNARAKELSYLRAMGYKYGFPVTPVPRRYSCRMYAEKLSRGRYIISPEKRLLRHARGDRGSV